VKIILGLIILAATARAEIANFAVVDPGVYRGGQPSTSADWSYLKSIGVTNIIKLNTESEGSDAGARALGMHVTYIPVSLWRQFYGGPNFQTMSNTVAKLQPGTFIHCTHGQDRTGEFCGCIRVWQDGWSKQTAWCEMRAYGYHPILLGLTHFWNWHVK
jgi:protein tyrosine/serine phosphatase